MAEPPCEDLAGYEMLVCVCGGISAYKVCEVVSRLVQRGVEVTVAMSRAARKFVGPLTFQSLSGREVLLSLWKSQTPHDAQHIRETDNVDLVLVAPATANIIGKIAGGVADDLISTLMISNEAPVVLAPAMNPRMWHNTFVQENLGKLKNHNYQIVGPGEGWLACRSVGMGRMAEPVEIIETVATQLRSSKPLGATLT